VILPKTRNSCPVKLREQRWEGLEEAGDFVEASLLGELDLFLRVTESADVMVFVRVKTRRSPIVLVWTIFVLRVLRLDTCLVSHLFNILALPPHSSFLKPESSIQIPINSTQGFQSRKTLPNNAGLFTSGITPDSQTTQTFSIDRIASNASKDTSNAEEWSFKSFFR
jgi:hypothetical protein